MQINVNSVFARASARAGTVQRAGALRAVASIVPRASRINFAAKPRSVSYKKSQTVCMADAAAAGGGESSFDEYAVVLFPRVKERDVWRRLGISKQASYEEIQEARNYLVQEHKTHPEGVEAIETAFDKIIDFKLKERKKVGKITLKPKKEVTEGSWQQRLSSSIAKNVPQKVILQRAFVYLCIAVWSVYASAATGPVFQVLCSFGLTAYYIMEKRGGKQHLFGALLPSVGALFAGWLVGTVVPVYLPMLFPPAVSPETIAALFAYVSMWWAATFWK